MLEKLITRIKETWKPFLYYTAGQTALNGAIITYNTGGDIKAAASDAATNSLFIASVSLVYAQGIDYVTKKLGKYGRLGANAISLSVSAAFYGYGLLTNDTDPTLPATLGGIVGLTLTNVQVNEIQSREKNKNQKKHSKLFK